MQTLSPAQTIRAPNLYIEEKNQNGRGKDANNQKVTCVRVHVDRRSFLHRLRCLCSRFTLSVGRRRGPEIFTAWVHINQIYDRNEENLFALWRHTTFVQRLMEKNVKTHAARNMRREIFFPPLLPRRREWYKTCREKKCVRTAKNAMWELKYEYFTCIWPMFGADYDTAHSINILNA